MPAAPPPAPAAAPAAPRPRAAVVHLHLAQPPREDPWLGLVEADPEALPDHDRTARVERTCYRALAAARLHDADGRIARVVNLLAWTSWDVAPTLLAWLEREAPTTYAALLEGDRAARARLGHGAALAHPYHHVLLPLLSRRDKATEVRWGLADFRRRFGRAPSGLWCPETAVDDETLDVLAEHGVRFTVVAPHQVAGRGADGRPGRYRTAAGREIALVAYDAGLSHDVAFGGLLRDTAAWVRRMAGEALPADAPADSSPADAAADAAAEESADAGTLAVVATAAEVYGHHHVHGDAALAAMLDRLVERPHVRLETLAAVVAALPAGPAVTLVDPPGSWSCPHGVERWRSECGCRHDPTTRQGWRAPLRAAIAELGATLDARFAHEGGTLFGAAGADPWTVRDAYGGDGAGPVPETSDPVWARELLEMARETRRLWVSHPFYGDELGSLEVRQLLRTAARALALAGPHGPGLERHFVERLGAATSADPAVGSAREVYLRHARPTLPAPVRVAAGWATVTALGADEGAAAPPAWAVRPDDAAPDDPAAGRRLLVVDRRVGAESAFRVRVDVPGPAAAPGGARAGAAFRLADVTPEAITILARADGADPTADGVRGTMGAALKLADLPERARRAAELVLRRAVVDRLLDERARGRLAAGEATLRELVEPALVAAVQALASDESPAALTRALGLVDLAESSGDGVPFDAQTMLARVREAVDQGGRARLAPLAWRMGFSARAWLGAPPPRPRVGAPTV